MFQNIALPLHPQIAKQGALTKRLCGGLQNRIEQFDSATHLTKRIGNPCKSRISDSFFLLFDQKASKRAGIMSLLLFRQFRIHVRDWNLTVGF